MESGVSAILIHEDKILLQLRDNKLDISYPNFWGLIGGRIEENESPEETVKREVFEELGCKIDHPVLFRTFKFEGKIEYAFFERLNEINLNRFFEGQEIKLFDFNELSKLKIRPDDRETIEKYINEKINK